MFLLRAAKLSALFLMSEGVMRIEKSSEVVEIVIYTIKPEMSAKYVDTIIGKVRELVSGFEGFISFEFYQSSADEYKFMDHVRWSTLECAENAAKQFKAIQQAPEYKEYLDSFESLEILSLIHI